ncbi:hypothetical protein FPQ18DRAFT_356081 [Pyronema domesticum]|nr:hypothetical protein FPQ18DRAFT_356081 [Pyronema domesticum]
MGAGPTGLLLGLKFAQQRIDVLFLEAEKEIATYRRACLYMPIVLKEFEKVGLLDAVVKAGAINTEGMAFRTPLGKDNRLLGCLLQTQVPKDRDSDLNNMVVHVGQNELAKIIQGMAEKYLHFQVRLSNRFTGCQQDEPGKVRVGVSTPKGEQFMEADYVVGCDSGTSAVWRALCIPFQRFTWNDFRLIATNIRYP